MWSGNTCQARHPRLVPILHPEGDRGSYRISGLWGESNEQRTGHPFSPGTPENVKDLASLLILGQCYN